MRFSASHAVSLLLLATPLVAVPLLPAQQYTRNPLRAITGTVSTASHEPIRGAIVQLETTGSLTIQSYVTDERGTYTFRNLSSTADYTLWATYRGAHSKHESISQFDHHLDRTIPLTIHPAKD